MLPQQIHKKLYFHDKEGLKFPCPKILEVIAVLDKNLKIFIFIFSTLIPFFFLNIFANNIPLGRDVPAIPNLLLFV